MGSTARSICLARSPLNACWNAAPCSSGWLAVMRDAHAANKACKQHQQGHLRMGSPSDQKWFVLFFCSLFFVLCSLFFVLCSFFCCTGIALEQCMG